MTRRSSNRQQVERRAFGARLEVRKAGDGDPIGVTGHAAVFERDSLPLWDWWMGTIVERIAPGAFTKTIQEADICLLINHDANLVLARNKAGTLRLSEDGIGLLIDGEMGATSYARDLAISMGRGDVSQMSFAFRIVKEAWTETAEGIPLRTVQEAALSDVSIVTYPAYPDSEVGLRAQQFYGMARSLGLTELPATERDALLADLAAGHIDPTRLPALRAAHAALGTLLRTDEPTQPGHSPSVIDMQRRHHEANARRFGFALVG